ncbi:DUF1543 domain-containing protein [Mucilaginibacter lutimaris]|uniref:DUF1543 domain-containing protein n=1 Tax=Mucilaginibacter lutimaris TaxID=931629 RepID=A0ABW2Z922_9SPHI
MTNQIPTDAPKLYMLLLGSKAPGRHIEQHDIFFGIGNSLKELVPDIKAFWRNTGTSLHIDGYREVNAVNGYRVKVVPKGADNQPSGNRLFFVNLGGYLSGQLAEQHHIVLTVQSDKGLAIQQSKKTVFFRTNNISGPKGASAHVDDKYGIDVDDIYNIEEMLSPALKDKYYIDITPAEDLAEDEIHLGYFKLDKLT